MVSRIATFTASADAARRADPAAQPARGSLRPLPASSLIAVATLAAIGAATQIAAAGEHGRMIEFDAPGATTSVSAACGSTCGTQALANNDAGAVTGAYTDANVVSHGFLRAPDGRLESFDAPGAGTMKGADQGTFPYSINYAGDIAGAVQNAANVFHGFIRHPDRSYEIFAAPHAGTGAFGGTLVFNLNSEGDAAGVYLNASGEHGFIRWHSGDFSEFDAPGAVYTMVCEETCLNADGSLSGFYGDASGNVHGFLRARDGTLTSIDFPGALGTVAASINDAGEIGGYILVANGVTYGFVRHADGSFGASFDVPGAYNGANGGTAAFSINAFGATTGAYSDANLTNHGFARSADGGYALFDAPGGGTGAFQGTRPSTNNVQGEVAGWNVDAAGLNHAFVWIP